jgi:FkbM family methyltransferase
MRDIADWFRYKLLKKIRKKHARMAAAIVRAALRLRSRLGLGTGREFVTSRYGVQMKANWNDRTFQYCYFGTYGGTLARLVQRYDRPFVFLDIGANQGLYSLLAARNALCRLAVALEPVAATFKVLQQNVDRNGFQHRVTCIQAALSDRVGTADISVHASHSGTATLARGSNFDPASVQTVALIDCRALDEHIPAGPDIVVKVDVEGHEEVVIAQLLRSRHVARLAAVFYEVDSRWSQAGSLRAMLAAAGFANFVRHGFGRHYDILATR